MSSWEPDKPNQSTPDGAVHLYCMTALVADEASSKGHPDFARALEQLLQDFLSGLTREEQSKALRLSYEMALRGEEAAPPRLRLAYSRD